jgi:hypothetical protein
MHIFLSYSHNCIIVSRDSLDIVLKINDRHHFKKANHPYITISFNKFLKLFLFSKKKFSTICYIEIIVSLIIFNRYLKINSNLRSIREHLNPNAEKPVTIMG